MIGKLKACAFHHQHPLANMIKKKFRIPRKLKKKIPKGLYCYTPTSGFQKFPDGTWGYKIKLCPFYGHIKLKDWPVKSRPKYMDDEFIQEFGEQNESWCKLVKWDVMDQCKSCGVKYDLKQK
jgi:hypothetical protein